MSRQSIVIYGPKACGKTTHAEQLRKHLGLDTVVDDWDGRARYPATGALVLTNHPDADVRGAAEAMHFGAAMRDLRSEVAP